MTSQHQNNTAHEGLKPYHSLESSGLISRAGARARLDGDLAVSRALGDAPLRHHGLSAQPELAPWLEVGPGDAALLLASDGVFEALPAEDACRIALNLATGGARARVGASIGPATLAALHVGQLVTDTVGLRGPCSTSTTDRAYPVIMM